MEISKKRPCFAVISAIASTILLLLIVSCNKEDELTQEIRKEQISGYIQKGPFVNGTQILMVELSPVMKQTGKMFSTQITNNHGEFEINDITLTSNFVEISASGYYFDEVKGDISTAPLNLFALSDIKNKTSINVNLLTHLEKRRIEYLMGQQKEFSEAKKAAQQEILAIFGIEGDSMQNSELLDISVNNDDNAKLLAISVILQGNRSVGELTELMANIANEIHEDGILDNENLIADLRSSAVTLDLVQIRKNLEARYKTIDISASIPDFEKYVLNFLKHTASSPTGEGAGATNITATSATLNAYVNPYSMSTIVTFEYGTTPEYGNTIAAGQSPVSNSNFVAVSVEIDSLQVSTSYHFRVKAENELGEIYGEDFTFTTLANLPTVTTSEITDITSDSALSGGNVTDDGGDDVIEKGIVWSSTENPQIENNEGITTDGEGSGEFTSSLARLSPVTTYYVRAYATNSTGTAYGNNIQFNTLANLPNVTTLDITGITFNSAKSGGYIIDDGGAVIIEKGIVWSSTENPTIDESEGITTDGEGSGEFESTLTELGPGTRYYVRAYASNIIGTAYGEQVEFVSDEEHFAGGNGTKDEPYLISTHSQLDSVRYFLTSHFKQISDIDLSGYTTGTGWEPIGGEGNWFFGTFDGNGYEISNMYINLERSNYVGLFSFVLNAVLKNITLTAIDVTGNEFVGGIAGFAAEGGELINCNVSGIISGIGAVGGIAGDNYVEIISCSFYGDVNGSYKVGGIAGESYKNINDSYFTGGSVTGENYIGGVCGLNAGQIIKCFATGNVTGNTFVGGLVGMNYRNNIIDSYANTNTSSTNAGGMVGLNDGGDVINCYSLGNVSGGASAGGLIGEQKNFGKTYNSYYNLETSGQNDTDKGVPKTTVELMQQSTFETWDFTTIWKIDEGNSYPLLRWQK